MIEMPLFIRMEEPYVGAPTMAYSLKELKDVRNPYCALEPLAGYTIPNCVQRLAAVTVYTYVTPDEFPAANNED